jgi:hypothetical protein
MVGIAASAVVGVVVVVVDAIAYTAPAAMEVARLTAVQKFADIPVEAKIMPSFIIVGCNESLNLFNI